MKPTSRSWTRAPRESARESSKASRNPLGRTTLKTLGPFRGSVKDSTYILRMLTPTVAYLGAEVDTSAGGLIVRYSSLPPSLEAHGRVTAAWQHFFETPRDTVGVFAELDTAARLDSTYVVPLLMKAYMLDVKSQWPGVSSIVQRVRPLAPRMSRLEKAVLELFEADLRGDGLDRVEIARRLQALSPGSAEMPLLRVVSAMYIGHVQEALAAINETDPTRGMNLVTPTLLEWSAMTYHHSGSESLEERAVREELKRFKHHPPATYGLARIYAASDDSDLDELLEKGMPPARDANDPRDPVADRIELKAFAARELRSHGYATRARTIFQQLIKDEWQTPPATVVEMKRRARVLYDAGDYTAARTAYEEVMQRDSTDLEALGRIATSALRLGDTVTARRIDERLAKVQRPFLMGANHRWRAAIAAAQGRTAEAVAHLETATRQGLRLMDSPPNLTIHLDPDFVGIEKTAAFKAMLKSLAEASAVK
jgi:tetratricopeptide (TPR) repeat protein